MTVHPIRLLNLLYPITQAPVSKCIFSQYSCYFIHVFNMFYQASRRNHSITCQDAQLRKTPWLTFRSVIFPTAPPQTIMTGTMYYKSLRTEFFHAQGFKMSYSNYQETSPSAFFKAESMLEQKFSSPSFSTKPALFITE